MINKTDLFLQVIKDSSKNNVVTYVRLMKEVFSIEDLCDLLKINRNRYNYLNRHSMLNWHIAKIGGYVYET